MGHRDCRRCSPCRRPRVLRGVRVAASAPKPSGAGRATARNLPTAGCGADRHDSLRQGDAYTARTPHADGIPGTRFRDTPAHCDTCDTATNSDALPDGAISPDANPVRLRDPIIVPPTATPFTPGVTPAPTPSGPAVLPTVAVATPTATRPQPAPTPAPLDDTGSRAGQTWSDRWVKFTVEPHVCGHTLEFRGHARDGARVGVQGGIVHALQPLLGTRPAAWLWWWRYNPPLPLAGYIAPAPAGSEYPTLPRDQIVADTLSTTIGGFHLSGDFPSWLPDPEDAVLAVWGYRPDGGGPAALRLIEVQEC